MSIVDPSKFMNVLPAVALQPEISGTIVASPLSAANSVDPLDTYLTYREDPVGSGPVGNVSLFTDNPLQLSGVSMPRQKQGPFGGRDSPKYVYCESRSLTKEMARNLLNAPSMRTYFGLHAVEETSGDVDNSAANRTTQNCSGKRYSFREIITLAEPNYLEMCMSEPVDAREKCAALSTFRGRVLLETASYIGACKKFTAKISSDNPEYFRGNFFHDVLNIVTKGGLLYRALLLHADFSTVSDVIEKCRYRKHISARDVARMSGALDHYLARIRQLDERGGVDKNLSAHAALPKLLRTEMVFQHFAELGLFSGVLQKEEQDSLAKDAFFSAINCGRSPAIISDALCAIQIIKDNIGDVAALSFENKKQWLIAINCIANKVCTDDLPAIAKIINEQLGSLFNASSEIKKRWLTAFYDIASSGGVEELPYVVEQINKRLGPVATEKDGVKKHWLIAIDRLSRGVSRKHVEEILTDLDLVLPLKDDELKRRWLIALYATVSSCERDPQNNVLRILKKYLGPAEIRDDLMKQYLMSSSQVADHFSGRFVEDVIDVLERHFGPIEYLSDELKIQWMKSVATIARSDNRKNLEQTIRSFEDALGPLAKASENVKKQCLIAISRIIDRNAQASLVKTLEVMNRRIGSVLNVDDELKVRWIAAVYSVSEKGCHGRLDRVFEIIFERFPEFENDVRTEERTKLLYVAYRIAYGDAEAQLKRFFAAHDKYAMFAHHPFPTHLRRLIVWAALNDKTIDDVEEKKWFMTKDDPSENTEYDLDGMLNSQAAWQLMIVSKVIFSFFNAKRLSFVEDDILEKVAPAGEPDYSLQFRMDEIRKKRPALYYKLMAAFESETEIDDALIAEVEKVIDGLDS